ncbi:N-acetylmuramic acid 6-phosphate etherase [Arenibacter algicola]|uniref:N-acetylmuramic acid 6-phosphate etherase n=1 Tax=Arenibacter algicola TaxID=616991 RepID=UPI001C06DFBB|nr:N-acetylmuramic acid 6-phosphate etherase [Arenibacter algicola]MBU2903606.1 N-acetylmuramic acid 6-phosphate etherase [Arenibacter algicola]
MKKTNIPNISYFLALDIGGTWIKGTVIKETFLKSDLNQLSSVKVKSPLKINAQPKQLTNALKELLTNLQVSSENIKGIGISTPGIVNYEGSKVVGGNPYLEILQSETWKNELETLFQCHVSFINDADAVAIGLSQLGKLKGNKTIGLMPIGTGVGFSIWRNGRRWRPGKLLPLVGSIITPKGDYNNLVSASNLAVFDKNHDLIEVLLNNTYQKERKQYHLNLLNLIYSVAIIYGLDEVIISGGLVEAANVCNYPLQKELDRNYPEFSTKLDKPLKIIVSENGNSLQLIGALALAKAESIAYKYREVVPNNKMVTETPYIKDIQLQNMDSGAIIETMWEAEQRSGEALKESLSKISNVVDIVVKKLEKGGRIIYVGAGTSGRIAAMDAVEIPCTFGFPEDRVLALISGGITDATMEIETNFEEDASAIPEMLLLDLCPEDSVIGITASGSAYYVQSALAFAKSIGSYTVMIRAEIAESKLSLCDDVIALHSGHEVIAGSTRMKAGTATKKVLNFMSTTIMIKLGKVAGPYMVNMACINTKLIERAVNILKTLYNLTDNEALQKLKDSNMELDKAIKNNKL